MLPLSLNGLPCFGWLHYFVVSANNIFDFIFDLFIVCSLVDFVLSSDGRILIVNVLSSEKAK